MILFGAKTRAKPVAGGRVVDRHCDDCGRVTTFRECDVTDKFHVFFVDLGSSAQRRLVCVECGEDVEMEAPAAPRAAPVSARPTPEPPAKRSFSERDKDKMLAELKKKMKPR